MRFRFHQFLSIVILALALVSSGQAKNTCRAVSLPSGATAVLNEKYPDWRIKSVSDLIADDQVLWAKAHPEECPGIAIGHFEQSDRVAYAVLIVPRAKTRHGYKIIVLKESPSGDGYTAKLLDQANGEYSDSGLVIPKAPPDKYSDFYGTTEVRVKLDAIFAEWIEKASVLYYCANGKYRKIQTSD
jgi:hypothetical protein